MRSNRGSFTSLARLLVVLGAAGVLATPALGKSRTDISRTSVDDEVVQSRERFTWADRLAPGRTLEIKGINGDIHAELADGDEAEVVARKTSRRSDLASVKIEVVEHEDGVTICARYPRPDGSLNDCDPGDGGHGSNVRNNDVQVDFRVRVPRGVSLVLRTVNGEIEATGLRGQVDANTVNGGVSVATTGLARAATVNGSIVARMGESEWDGDLEFSTVNGSVRLELPQGIDADVSASTTNGDITTDFPLTVKGRFSSRRLQGTIGRGGRDLSLSTVNGSISLRAIE